MSNLTLQVIFSLSRIVIINTENRNNWWHFAPKEIVILFYLHIVCTIDIFLACVVILFPGILLYTSRSMQKINLIEITYQLLSLHQIRTIYYMFIKSEQRITMKEKTVANVHCVPFFSTFLNFITVYSNLCAQLTHTHASRTDNIKYGPIHIRNIYL